MTERYIEHVTLTTGDSRRAWRREVGEDVIAHLAPLIERALTGEHVAIPGGIEPPGCTMTGGAAGRCISLTVWGPPLHRAAFPQATADIAEHRVPIAEIGIATHSRCGAVLWRSLHCSARRLDIALATGEQRRPPEPWVAALLYPHGAAIYVDAMHWLGDFERCLAWAWLDSRGRAE